MSRKRPFTLALAAGALFAGGCQGSEGNQSTAAAGNDSGGEVQRSSSTIGQSLGQSSDHSTLASAVETAGLAETLTGSQPYTLFAPTNAAFQKLQDAEALMQPDQKGRLTGILTYHIVPGVVTAEDISRAIQSGEGKTELATMGGANLAVTREGNAIILTGPGGDKARVTQPDMVQSNGVVHSIDTVLMPG